MLSPAKNGIFLSCSQQQLADRLGQSQLSERSDGLPHFACTGFCDADAVLTHDVQLQIAVGQYMPDGRQGLILLIPGQLLVLRVADFGQAIQAAPNAFWGAALQAQQITVLLPK